MKKSRILFETMFCLAAASVLFSSCLGDNDNDNEENYHYITAQEANQAMQAISGTYNGFVYYFTDETHSKRDSVASVLTVNTDSTFTLSQFPIKVITTNSNNLNSILFKSENKPVTGKISLPKIVNDQDMNKQVYRFIVKPTNSNLSWETDKKTISLNFTETLKSYLFSRIYYSIGTNVRSEISATFLTKDIKYENQTFLAEKIFTFYGKK